MNVTLYVYEIMTKRVRGKIIQDVSNFENDLLRVVQNLMKIPLEDRKKDFEKDKKVLYLEDFDYDKTKRTMLFTFVSAKYNNTRSVIAVNTLKEKKDKKKGPLDGDKEYTRLIIRFDSVDGKEATGILQHNSNGVSISKIKEYFTEKIWKYHCDVKQDDVRYEVLAYNKLSREFIIALENAKRISALKVTIETEDVEVSEFKKLSELNDINDDVEIMMKPVKRGASINPKTVKNFYNIYKENPGRIKRIWVNTEDMEKNPLSFDTDKVKEKIVVKVGEEEGGQPDSRELITMLKSNLQKF